MMKNKVILLTVLLALTSPVFGIDYITQRQEATDLVKARDYDKALVLLQTMAKSNDVSDVQKVDAQVLAFECMLSLKQYEQADKWIESIDSVPYATLCRMELHEKQRQYKEVLELSKDMKIDEWPDAIKGDAYSMRGASATRAKEYELAISDLTNALDYKVNANDKANGFNILATAYHLSGDDENALATYRKTLTAGQKFKGTTAAIAIADILRKQKKTDEALAVLQAWDKETDIEEMGKANAVWPAQFHMAYARVLVDQGKTAQAISHYKQALALEKISPSLKNAVEKALADLEGGKQ